MDYLYFKFKHKPPFYFMNMSRSQQIVARAYMLKLIDEKKEEAEEIEKSMNSVT